MKIINSEENTLNADGLCLVHATRYPVSRDEEGNISLDSTAGATEYKDHEKIRTSVHFALNGIVGSHQSVNGGGNWDKVNSVYIMPYEQALKDNDKPDGFHGVDTFFCLGADKKMLLRNPYIVTGGTTKNGNLFEYNSERDIIFKSSDFTVEDINKIMNGYSSLKTPHKERGTIPLFEDRELAEIAKDVGIADIQSDTSTPGLVKGLIIKIGNEQGMNGFSDEVKQKIQDRLFYHNRMLTTAKVMENAGYEYMGIGSHEWDRGLYQEQGRFALQNDLQFDLHANLPESQFDLLLSSNLRDIEKSSPDMREEKIQSLMNAVEKHGNPKQAEVGRIILENAQEKWQSQDSPSSDLITPKRTWVDLVQSQRSDNQIDQPRR